MKEISPKIGDVVQLYDYFDDKWEDFIIMCEEDLEMVLAQYEWKLKNDNTKEIQKTSR